MIYLLSQTHINYKLKRISKLYTHWSTYSAYYTVMHLTGPYVYRLEPSINNVSQYIQVKKSLPPVIYYRNPFITLALVACLLSLLNLCVVHDPYNYSI